MSGLQWAGLCFVFAGIASLLLVVCACVVAGKADERAEKLRRAADVRAVEQRAGASGFLFLDAQFAESGEPR